jgi:hypothetical protein
VASFHLNQISTDALDAKAKGTATPTAVGTTAADE